MCLSEVIQAFCSIAALAVELEYLTTRTWNASDLVLDLGHLAAIGLDGVLDGRVLFLAEEVGMPPFLAEVAEHLVGQLDVLKPEEKEVSVQTRQDEMSLLTH